MILYIVATPIGNLEDLTVRARNILANVPVVFAEDTRHAKILLSSIEARPQLISYHQHTTPRRMGELLDILENNDAALITDAGTPGVNDPGGLLVAAAIQRFGAALTIVPIPGPNAAMAAASVSGFPMDQFLFLGFPPHKKGRKTFFDQVATTDSAVIFYESTHRILKALTEMEERSPERSLVVCRELTKKFETIYRGFPKEIAKQLEKEARGEFVVVVAPKS